MEILVLFGAVVILYFINKAALRTARNVGNEQIAREINKKLIQNRKLDELYGRNSGTPGEQLTKAIQDVAKDKAEISFRINE